jgi:hypothetical protein
VSILGSTFAGLAAVAALMTIGNIAEHLELAATCTTFATGVFVAAACYARMGE